MSAECTTVCDVLIVGSGAGGMSAGITARLHGLEVLIVEKEPCFGGSLARSGGWCWIPCNPLARREGIVDSVEAARTYLQHEAGNLFDPERVDAYLAHAPRMVEFLEKKTSVKFIMDNLFADYHSDAPGAVAGGRSICSMPFDGRELGAALAQLSPHMRELTFLGVKIGSGTELKHFFNVTRSLRSALFVARHLARHLRDLIIYGRPLRLVNGNALAARLAKSAFDLGIPLWLSAPARELVPEGGAVRGAILLKEGKPVRVVARRGVVLACGGFPHDLARRQVFFSKARPGSVYISSSTASPGNTGDGLRLAESVGGEVEDRLLNAIYSVPVSRVPLPGGSMGIYPHLIDRGKPGVIAVMPHGQRFVNESDSYHDVAQAILRASPPGAEAIAFLVCDHRAIRRYGLGFAKPTPVPLSPYLRSGYLIRGATVEDVARKAGIDPAGLVATIEEFNKDARVGRDHRFARGSSAYNQFQGNAMHRPNPCLAPLDHPPFYAVRVVPGDFGTLAGLRTNGRAQVLGKGGRSILGLYAVGNDMSSIFSGGCPGGGSTIGPAMTFGYIAGLHLAGKEP